MTQHKNIKEIERAAIAEGFRDLSSDGVLKVINGFTTLSEVFRVAPHSSEELFEIDDDDVVSPESETEEEDIRPVAVESIKPKRILQIDDEQFMLQFQQGVLEGEGGFSLTQQPMESKGLEWHNGKFLT